MNIRSIHRDAMNLARNANAAFEEENFKDYYINLNQAFELEKRAAKLLKNRLEAEPTRSVLFRSAANMGFSLRKYEEAYDLAFEALKGNPYPEIRAEIGELLHNIADAYLPVKPKIGFNPDYLNLLRKRAVPFKLEEKSGKFGGAIVLEHVMEFFKNLQNSYQNFAEIQFRKNVSEEDVEDLDYSSKKFKNSSSLLIPDLDFQSFGVSIVASDEVMDPFGLYHQGFKEMRSNLFMNFKDDVLLPEYNDSSFHTRISEKYSDEERRRIFSPIINSIQKSKGYNITITDNKFLTRVKTFEALSDPAVQILKPKKEEKKLDDLKLSRKIIQTKGSSNRTISFEFIKHIEFQIEITEVTSDDKIVYFNNSHSFLLVFDENIYTINDDVFNIFVKADEYFLALKKYDQEFINKYHFLLMNKDNLLPNQLSILENIEISTIRNW